MFYRGGSLQVLAYGLLGFLPLAGCGGGGGGTPTPQLATLAPDSAWAGQGDTTMYLDGSAFRANSVAQWNGTALSTTYLSSEQLRATIPVNLLASAGTAQVTVSDGGSPSAPLTFTIDNPAPVLASLSPQSATAGSGPITLTVTGSSLTSFGANGFVSASVAMWNNRPLATSFVNASTIKATVPASMLASADSAQITVSTPTPGGAIPTHSPSTSTRMPPPLGMPMPFPGAWRGMQSMGAFTLRCRTLPTVAELTLGI